MSKEEVLELAKKYSCDVEFGTEYYKYRKVNEGGTLFSTYTKVPIEELLANNPNRCVYIHTLKNENVLWGEKKSIYDENKRIRKINGKRIFNG
jgi:hypothetical protein